MITETTIAVRTPQAKNIPTELMRLPQWVNWRFGERGDDLTKVPYIPQTGRRASTTDATTWRPYVDAWQFLRDPQLASIANIDPYDGIGFVFSEDDPYTGIDLDDCRDPESGELKGWAKEVMGQVGTEAYTELSPSGRGIHIIVRGSVRGGGMRKGSIEMYSRGRFFTVTGRSLWSL